MKTLSVNSSVTLAPYEFKYIKLIIHEIIIGNYLKKYLYKLYRYYEESFLFLTIMQARASLM